MSVRWMGWVWDEAPQDYTGKRLLLLLALADTAHDDGRLWITQEHLARKTRCSVEWVRLTIRELVEAGYITIVEKGYRGRATTYQLNRQAVTPKPVGENADAMTPSLLPDDPNSSGDNPNSGGDNPKSTKHHPSYTSVPTSVEPAVAVATTAARSWWEAQHPRPIGRSAWHSLVSVCKAAAERGYDEQDIRRALDSVGVVPSVQQMERALRGMTGRGPTARERRLQQGVALVGALQEAEQSAWALPAGGGR